MSIYYNSQHTRNLFNPKSKTPFRLSRSKIDLFLSCPRCFYLDRRLGVSRPPGFPFSLNSAVDTLLKKEFDIHRSNNTPHPLMKTYGLDLVPFKHPKMDEWRNVFQGVRYFHQPTNFIVTGAIDDLWVDRNKMLYVVDYKATSKVSEVNLDADWQISYKRQVEVYQWLLRQNGFNVAKTTYFVYCNGKTDLEAFDGKLEFSIKIIPYEGDDSWVEPTLIKIHHCLMSDKIPEASPDCDYCAYRKSAKIVESSNASKQNSLF